MGDAHSQDEFYIPDTFTSWLALLAFVQNIPFLSR